MSQQSVYIDTDILRVAAELASRHKLRTYERMCIETDHRVLDVGCGPGNLFSNFRRLDFGAKSEKT